MKKLITILLFVFILGFTAFAQEKTFCPNIEIVNPSTTVRTGEVMSFSLTLDKEPEELDLKYSWDVNKGKIVKGKETKRISVSTEGIINEILTASVEGEGLPKNCNNEFSETGIVIGGGHPVAIDDFGDIAVNDLKARIDAFIVELQNSPNSKGVIAKYGSPETVAKLEKLIKKHLKFRGFDTNIITFQNRGKEKQIRTRLWRVPPGADTSCVNWFLVRVRKINAECRKIKTRAKCLSKLFYILHLQTGKHFAVRDIALRKPLTK